MAEIDAMIETHGGFAAAFAAAPVPEPDAPKSAPKPAADLGLQTEDKLPLAEVCRQILPPVFYMNQTPSSAFESDLLGRQPFCQRLESFISTEHHFVEGGLVISLNARFGSGKTTFLNMWSGDLQTRRQAKPELPRPVVVNAWESDYCGDPLIAIISALSNALADKTAADAQPVQASALREAAKDIGWFALGLANSFVNDATGLDAVSAAELAEQKKTQRGEAGKSPANILDVYDRKREALSKLKATLTSAFGEAEPKAIVFIDELDRCRPDYAISYLETIKHIFDIHGIVFVLSVDEHQLQSATSVLFGPGLVFREYFRKFAHRSIQLPAPAKSDIHRLAQSYAQRYLQQDGRRWCILPLGHQQIENIALLLGAFKLSPRQVQEVFRILGHAYSKAANNDNKVLWCFGSGILFLAGLRVANQSDYHRLGQGMLPIQDLAALLAPLTENKHNFEWWFIVLAAGFKQDEAWKIAVTNEIKRLKLTGDNTKVIDLPNVFGQYNQGWGRYYDDNSGLNNAYLRIESIQTFSD
jgi:hypothetical protein